jgi:GntR family transcriptional regulator, transcriptional repressor for pyruvate dehydrogenase complex
MTDLPRLGRAKLSEQVADVLEHRILNGHWHPGHALQSESVLGGELCVSRSVIRDAVKTLAARGLVTVRQGVGTFVAEPTDAAYADALVLLLLRSGATIREVLEARALLEINLAAVAATRRTEEDCTRLQRHLDEFAAAAEAVDWERGSSAHLEFHFGILDAIHAPVLRVLLRPMQEIILVSSYGPVEDEPVLWDLPIHAQILAAIRAGEEGSARETMRRHFCFIEDERYREYYSTRFSDAPTLHERLRRRQQPSPARARM